MAYNGSGTFLINSAGQPVVANTVISATTFNALTADLANGLSTAITKDGQTTPTANIPMGGFKITNLANGTAATDAATVAQIQSNGAALVTVTGTDTLVGTLTPALTTYVTGAVYYFIAPATNTGAVTLNIDTLGAKSVTRDGTTALVAGDLVSGEMVAVVYDGTRFQLISSVNSFTNLNVSGTLTVAGAATLNGNLQVGNAASDTVNFQASGWTLTNNVSITGTWADIGSITTADINGGTIDGTVIGGGSAAAGTFTTVGATTGNITTVNATTVDSTNLEVTNLKAKDGTAAGSVADATGVVTLNSLVATTADINGGTVDGVTIGGSAPGAGTFTSLQATNLSAASANLAVAVIGTFTATTLDLTNLEVTNIKSEDGTLAMTVQNVTGKVTAGIVSVASMTAGVALITNGTVTSLTATSASIASANLGTAVITNGTVTNLTATSASVASVNAGVALLTTATVTNLTASGASIASANIGNLQFTAASIASINAGVAVITNLTATGASIASANVGTAVITAATVTGASIASANVGTAVITTGTVTNLTSTSASVASINAAVALITTGTVTALTATGASVASANVGTAVVTGLTVTGASIASVNVGAAVLSGNLTLDGGTANGVLYLNGSKVATSGSALTFNGTALGVTNGQITQQGGISTGGANATILANSSGQAQLWATGADASTRGTFNFVTARSDLSSSIEVLKCDTSGNLTASGNLGIGISPDERLTVTATNPTDGRVASLRNNATSSLTGTKLWFNQATVDNWNIGQPAGVNAFVFCNSTGSSNERMRLTAAGELLVGVNTATANGGVIQVSNGITFPATQSAASNANTLDDYEEGTFTPTALGSTTAGTTTYVSQAGSYTKIGRQVTASVIVNYSAMTGTGNLQIGGLPFTKNSDGTGVVCPVMTGNLNWSGGTSIVGFMGDGYSYVLLYGIADDGAYTVQGCVNEAAEIYLTVTYFV